MSAFDKKTVFFGCKKREKEQKRKEAKKREKEQKKKEAKKREKEQKKKEAKKRTDKKELMRKNVKNVLTIIIILIN